MQNVLSVERKSQNSSLLRKSLSSLLALAIGFAPAVSYTEEVAPTTQEEEIPRFQRETLDIFKSHMDVPQIQRLWHEMLRLNFAEPLDLVVGDYYRQSPILRPIFQAFYENQGLLLKNYITVQMLNTEIVHEGISDSVSLRFLELAKETLEELGFGKTASKKLMLSLQNDPGPNAYTISPSADEVFIGATRGLIDLMPHGQLKAVLGHESGHVILGHILNGIMFDLMSMLLANTVTEPQSSSKNFNIDLFVNAPWTKPEHNLAGEPDHQPHWYIERAHIRESMAEWLSEDGEPSPEMQLRMQAMNHLMNLDPKTKKQMLAEFVGKIIGGLKTINAPPAVTIGYLTELQKSLLADSKLHFNIDELVTHLKVTDSFLSQAAESGCDRIAASLVSNDRVAVSMAFLKNGGVRVNGEFAKNTKRAKQLKGEKWSPQDELKKQIKNSLLTFDEVMERAASEPGGLSSFLIGASHPPLTMRIWLINRFARYPAIVFANPFLRNVLLENSLRSNITGLDQLIKSNPQISAEGKTSIAETREAYSKTQILLAQQIPELIMGYEKRLVKEGKRNVRLDNLFQYVMALQQFLLEEAKDANAIKGELTEQLKNGDAKAQESIDRIDSYINSINAEIKEGSPVLDKVEQYYNELMAKSSEGTVLKKNIPNRLAEIRKFRDLFNGEGFSASTFDPKILIEARASITPEGRSRIPHDCHAALAL